MSEVGLDAAIGRKRLIFEAFIVNELRLVNQEPRERQRVGTSWSVLRNDYGARTVVESNDVLIFGWLDNGLAERFGRSPSNHIMQAIDEAISESLQECAFTVEVDGDEFNLYWHGTTATCPYTVSLDGEDYKLYFNY